MYSLKKLEKIANDWVSGKTDTLQGIENRLISWFCFTLNTTPTDPRLLEMTLEELIVFYLGHKIHADPSYMLTADKDEYEEWLKQEMGENYISEDQMVEAQIEIDKKEQEIYEKIKDKLPDKITTDFSQINKGDD